MRSHQRNKFPIFFNSATPVWRTASGTESKKQLLVDTLPLWPLPCRWTGWSCLQCRQRQQSGPFSGGCFSPAPQIFFFLNKNSLGAVFCQHLLPERVSSQADVVAAEWNPNTEQISDLKFISDSESRLVKTVKNYWMCWWHCILDCLAPQLGGLGRKEMSSRRKVAVTAVHSRHPPPQKLEGIFKKEETQLFDLKCSECC